MSKVYIHRPNRPDKLIGIVKGNGQVYRFAASTDNRVGHVNLHTGEIFQRQLGPDKLIGRVDFETGEVLHLTGAESEERLGDVQEDGRMFRGREQDGRQCVGLITHCLSPAYAGAAFLLLILPTLETLSPDSVP